MEAMALVWYQSLVRKVHLSRTFHQFCGSCFVCHFDADPDPRFQIKVKNLEKVHK
jgi:hypothetical protein